MKIVCISDTHGLHRIMKHKMPKGDILVVAGDISKGTRDSIESFGVWLKKLPYKKKFVIAGNHDWPFELTKEAPEWLMKDNTIVYLQDTEYIYEGLKIYGTPWQPRFCNWAFNIERGYNIRQKWNLIPIDTDILITHGPPVGVRDFVPYNQTNVGCVDLLDKIDEVCPKLHVFGHTHHDNGITEQDSTTFVNAAICDEKYRPNRKPIVVEI